MNQHSFCGGRLNVFQNSRNKKGNTNISECDLYKNIPAFYEWKVGEDFYKKVSFEAESG